MKILKKVFGKKIIRIFYNKNDIIRILNYVECESHDELLISGLKEILK